MLDQITEHTHRSPDWYLAKWRRRVGLEPGLGKAARFRNISAHVHVSTQDILSDALPKYVESEYRFDLRQGPQICAYCSKCLRRDEVTQDHVIPRARGGSLMGPDNLVPACGPCNRLKADDSLLLFLCKRRNS